MVTTLRAVVAVSLLLGFYVLVAVVIGLAVVIDVAVFLRGNGQGVQVAVAVTLVAIALVRGLVMIPRRNDHEQPGIAVSDRDEPELWRTVRALADQASTRAPDEIRLVPDVNAAVSEDTTMLGLRATRRRMLIGVPLLMTLTRGEMRAVLGHELGHYSGAHTRLGAPVYRGRIALIAAVRGLEGHRFTQSLFRAYAKLYLRVSQAVSRRQELEADALAVRIAGRSAMAGALRKVHAYAPAWEVFMESYAGLAGPAQARPADLFGGFHAMINDPERQRQIAEFASAPEQPTPYDSHPPLSERVAAIAHLPEPGGAVDAAPAAALLADPATAARATQESLWTEQARALPSLPWEQLVARGMFVAANMEASRDLAVAAQQVLHIQHPFLDAALEVLGRGQGHQLHAALVALGWDDDPRVLPVVVRRALEAALIEHGVAAWTLSWSEEARLRDRESNELDLTHTAEALITDPVASVPRVREWLAHNGVPRDHQPRAVRELSG
ncbi:M48 family metallopeptidase [Spiractinospora alimapuensis]|uniref:M48 family metallopeptidase n=1 Tax=Spiractinospora alimapuensis TaxID=2820884 RepID=UPI001F3795F4|nr:M48 family metallopeptidase [Spiractinospora alimapuensis]QVQ52877.1 M48 family metallopeptidase [Spiractinospora alimapuensis]